MASNGSVKTLADIPRIAINISNITRNSAKLLHMLIFEEDKLRKNRSNLRKFSGFTFIEKSSEYDAKVEFIKTNFIDRELIQIGTVLGLNYSNNIQNEDIIKDIINKLMNLDLLIHEEEEEEEEEEDEDADQTDNEEEGEDKDGTSCVQGDSLDTNKVQHELNKCVISFKDVEDTIRIFNGKDNYSVERWISDFEELSELLGWNELQKFLFARKSIDGVAKLYMSSEKNINSWAKLKSSLLNEFSSKISSADLHRSLMGKKMKQGEDVYEYFLAMKELASRGQIENSSLIQYTIEGIQDSSENKIMLYGARSIDDFKEKLRHYAAYLADRNSAVNRANKSKFPSTSKSNHNQHVHNSQKGRINHTKLQRCYNCGEVGHKAINCSSKNLGMKCFKCNNFGHKANDCSRSDNSRVNKNLPVGYVSTSKLNNMCKNVHVNAVVVVALIDTGSEINLVREDILKATSLLPVKTTEIKLTGLGGQEVITDQIVQTNVTIDEEKYEVKLRVVPKNAMKMDMILGNEFIKRVEIRINKDGIKIKNLSEVAEILNVLIDDADEQIEQLEHIGDVQLRNSVKSLIINYEPKKSKDLDMHMKILLKDETPIYYSPRRLPYSERDIVDEQVKKWLKDDIIEPCTSEFASQVVVVGKKDGSSRVCIDYRKLNKVAIKDRYPIPALDDLLDCLQNAKVFSTIDLKNGFFHMNIESNSKKYTSFVTHKGQFQFKRVPFGFCNSPASFQRYINGVFRELQNTGIVLIYMDDIIILAKNEKEAVERLTLTMNTAKEYGLNINFKKCQFLKRRIEFLGHIIENGKLMPSTEKIQAVLHFPEPKSVKDVQSFLGLAGYFRKFIYNYSIIARPLSDLIKKDKNFQFLESERSSFNTLKKLLSREPVLKIFERGADTELHTDASKFGYAGILMQKSCDDGKMHPVHYYSKKTTEAEEKYSSYELEVLAIIRSVNKFRIYLIGQHFRLVTDCSAFKQTMEKVELPPRVARWALQLAQYDYTIIHRKGERMKHVDSLSRYSIVMFVNEDSVVHRTKEMQKSDEYLKSIRCILQNQEYDNFYIKNDIVYKFEKGLDLLVVPEDMQYEIIKAAHEEGHFSSKKIIDKLSQEYYIPKLNEKVERIVKNCIKCILSNRKAGKREGFLHPRSKGGEPLYTFHMDHMGPLESTSKNYKHLLVIVDDFSKFVWIYPTKSTTTKEVIHKLEAQKRFFGNPYQVVTDRGTAFTSDEFQQYCEHENIIHHKVTTGLPRANGQVERINSIIISVLTKLSIDEPKKWYQYVDDVQKVLNSTYQRSIKTTPFKLLFGVEMKNKEDLHVKELIEDEFRNYFLQNREKIREDAKLQIFKIQKENSKYFNKKRREASKYKINDLVAIKRIQGGTGMKLRPRFLGPYKIVKVKGNDTYDVCKVGHNEGPYATSTCAEYIKPWNELALGSNVHQDGRVVGA